MTKHPEPPADSPPETQGPYRRWSRRKARKQHQAAQPLTESATPGAQVATGEATVAQAELPSLDTLDEDSQLGAFFAEGVSESLRRSALRKIFHLQRYNVCDGLDDYAEDYTHFEPLGEIMTADLRLRLEREQLKRALENAGQIGEPVDSEADRGEASSDPDQTFASRNDGGEPAAET
jgi:hypothetical protein